jgi:hypothetical protein
MKKLITTTMILALSIINPVKAQDIQWIQSKQEFDFTEEAKYLEEAVNQLGIITDLASQTAVLDIDWTFNFSDWEDDFDCTWRVEEPQVYFLPMNRFYNHLLLSVVTTPPQDYPFNTVSCRLTSEGISIRIKGFFVGSKIDVPTAEDVQLRPINPTDFPSSVLR